MIPTHWPGRTIWDTRVQSICGLLTAAGDHGVEIYFSASFAQVSLDPPRVIVNPNRTYAIEAAIQSRGRFAINVLATQQLAMTRRLVRMRRREPDKAALLRLDISLDHHDIPFLKDCQRTIFCEVESTIPSGDRKLYVARVLESRPQADSPGRPLLFAEVTTPASSFPTLRRSIRTLATVTGGLDILKTAISRFRQPPPPDIARTTYEQAGATETEIERINAYGLADRSHATKPPAAPALLRKEVGICVVGTGWGAFHCDLVREANPAARLFVCGRNAEKAERLAKRTGAEGFFVNLEQAANDPRIQALSLALPHDLHRDAAETVAAAGKHCLVEKPIATTLDDADAMIDAARKAGTILMVAEDMHFRPAVREAVRAIDRGDLGEPLYLLAHAGGIRKPRGWAADKDRMGGGVLMDIGVHYLRGLRLLMGEPDQVIASRAMQIDTKIEGEDSVQLLLSSSAGWQAHMLLSWASQRGNLPDLVVVGDQGTVHLWPGARYFDYYPVAPRPITKALSLVRPYWLRDKLSHPNQQRARVAIADADPTGYVHEFREFLGAVANDRMPVTPPADGRRDLEIVLCAYEALRTGRAVTIPPFVTASET